jgi:SAM-dependent methyltransferase
VSPKAVTLSERLSAIVDALPLRQGMRVLEIGCGPGAAAREIARRIGGTGHILAIDRSPRAIDQARASCREEILSGRMTVRCVAIEEFVLADGELPFDLAFAIRVGVLDGRHPERADCAKERIAAALGPRGRFFIDGGKPLKEIRLQSGTGRRR